MDAEPSLKERFERVREGIAAAARRSGRSPSDIVLIAVTKFAAIDEIRALIDLGQVDFGENRVQNLVQRAAQVQEFLDRRRERGLARGSSPASVRWHMIGRLQRNKVRKLLPLVRLVHSVDSLRLAEEIQAVAAKFDHPVEVLVQVNTSGERTKQGVAPSAARHFIEQIETMVNVRVRGLMCMAPLVPTNADEDAIAQAASAARESFTLSREVFEDIRASGAGGERFDILSMGMSGDYELAIECGSNMVRVGSAIFGSGGAHPDAPEASDDSHEPDEN